MLYEDGEIVNWEKNHILIADCSSLVDLFPKKLEIASDDDDKTQSKLIMASQRNLYITLTRYIVEPFEPKGTG